MEDDAMNGISSQAVFPDERALFSVDERLDLHGEVRYSPPLRSAKTAANMAQQYVRWDQEIHQGFSVAIPDTICLQSGRRCGLETHSEPCYCETCFDFMKLVNTAQLVRDVRSITRYLAVIQYARSL